MISLGDGGGGSEADVILGGEEGNKAMAKNFDGTGSKEGGG